MAVEYLIRRSQHARQPNKELEIQLTKSVDERRIPINASYNIIKMPLWKRMHYPTYELNPFLSLTTFFFLILISSYWGAIEWESPYWLYNWVAGGATLVWQQNLRTNP